MSFSQLKLLVYIPTYTDHKLAAAQAKRLRTEFQSREIQLWIAISVNSVNLSDQDLSELENLSDKLIHFSENLGGDTNINLGFISALSEQADFFWILSANDVLLPGAARKVQTALENSKADMLIISSSRNEQLGFLESAFSGASTQLPLGLISAVIYRCSVFRESFASALKFAWTGWGQLSVIQNALFAVNSLSYEIINEDQIYERGSDTSSDEQLKKNQSNYRHSFFGYPLVVALLFRSDKRIQNKIIRKWLWGNWYKIGFYKKGHSPYLESGETNRDVFWTEALARPFILKSGLASPLLYMFGNSVALAQLQDKKLLRLAKDIVYPRQKNHTT